MSATYVYKKFSAQDKAIIPFNAHKQYNFTSESAASNRVTYLTSSYTSESVSLYSSASAYYSGDIKNVVKYNQLDHLFYRKYRLEPEKKNDFKNWIKQRRELYENANILSVPLGLYGQEIRTNSFYLKAGDPSNRFEIVDDSYGNLMVSGTIVEDYPEIEECIFRIGPVDGHKRYDLNVFDDYAVVKGVGNIVFDNATPPNIILNPSPSQIQNFGQPLQVVNKEFYRQGMSNPDKVTTYTSLNKFMKRTQTKDGISSSFYEAFPVGPAHRYIPLDRDDSIFYNRIHYENVAFKESTLGSDNHKFPTITFNSATSSFIRTSHHKKYNFEREEEFAISFWVTPNLTGSLATEKRYIIAKNGTIEKIDTVDSTLQEIEESAGSFPYEIYMTSQSLYFSRSDGKNTHTINGEITSSAGTAEVTSHVLCQYTGSTMEIYFNGVKISSNTSNLEGSTSNGSHLYIGSRGTATTVDGPLSNDKFFNGDINDVNIFTRPFSLTEIANISSSVNASPYIGNLFQKSGFAAITHPTYTTTVLSGSNTLETLQFQGTHLIYEHEYQCTVAEHEFNYSTNQSMLVNNISTPYKLEGFTSESFFSPYITTIGLYNEAYELLAIAKLAQPIRCSDETDTTFVVRYDT